MSTRLVVVVSRYTIPPRLLSLSDCMTSDGRRYTFVHPSSSGSENNNILVQYVIAVVKLHLQPDNGDSSWIHWDGEEFPQ